MALLLYLDPLPFIHRENFFVKKNLVTKDSHEGANMFKSYINIAFRLMRKNKMYSLINIFGFAMGMAACVLILLWVLDELSYNHFHKNLERIFLVAQTQHYKTTGDFTVSPTPPALAPALKSEYPEISLVTRYTPYMGQSLVSYGNKKFNERIDFADPDFLRIFTFPFVKGDPGAALAEPYSVVITQKIAEKYFGDEDPIGKVFRVDGQLDFKVTGVLQNIPENSDIRFTFLASFETLHILGFNTSTWGSNSLFTYVLLKKGVSHEAVSGKIRDRIQKEIQVSTKPELFLFPFKKYHLYALSGHGGPIENVILFSIIAGFILLIACVNFINLTTARAAKRFKEVAIQKIVGATRSHLATKFFAESLLLAIIAAGFAMLLVELVLPVFNDVSGKMFTFATIGNRLVFLVVSTALFAGLVSGFYPALSVSTFQPLEILKPMSKIATKKFTSRRILVIFQFTISISLIIATTIVFRQLQFMRNKKLGLDKDNMVYFEVDGAIQNKVPAIKHELLQNRDIIDVCGTSHIPLSVYSNGGGWSWEGKDPQQDELITFLGADYDFLKTFEVKLNDGRFFSRQFGADSANTVVINQTFADLIGGQSAVGKSLFDGDQRYTIIGVVNNFNFTRVQNEIGPLLIYLIESPRYLFMKIRHENLASTLDYVKKVYKKFNPGYPVEYHFLDETYERMFVSEKRLSKIFGAFTVLAIVISCLGIFGLAAFVAEQKTKEIGIRKVLGASVSHIMMMLSQEFIRNILLANILSWPLAYYLMNKWLQNFAYRISIEWWVLALAGGLALVVALLTVSTQAIKAASANPVESLRYE
ncbi:MAG: FtsX-like permease family protein [Calditrichaeota bacterium]|nr:MAG: FtsX-like permease family protein [Calditrichota bacterium]